MPLKTPTPELDRRRALNAPRPPFDVLTDFYDWLKAKGLVIAEYGATKQRSITCSRCKGRGFDPAKLTAREQQLLTRGLLDDHDREKCEKCDGEGREWHEYVDEDSLEVHENDERPDRLFAAFWGLDLHKIDAEQRALLEEIREAQIGAPKRCRGCMAPHSNEGAYCDNHSTTEER